LDPNIFEGLSEIVRADPVQRLSHWEAQEVADAVILAWEINPLAMRGRDGDWLASVGLSCAVIGQRIDKAERLLSMGARFEAQRGFFDPPLVMAARASWQDGVEFMLARGAYVDEVGERGETAAMIAARRADSKVLAALLSAGADVFKKDSWGRTARDCSQEALAGRLDEGDRREEQLECSGMLAAMEDKAVLVKEVGRADSGAKPAVGKV
jgi:hypothetical protein